jgi:hypothetical protein
MSILEDMKTITDVDDTILNDRYLLAMGRYLIHIDHLVISNCALKYTNEDDRQSSHCDFGDIVIRGTWYDLQEQRTQNDYEQSFRTLTMLINAKNGKGFKEITKNQVTLIKL